MEILKNWKIHILALIVVIISESIVSFKYGLIVLFPMLYAMVIGGFISWPRMKILNVKDMSAASTVLGSLMVLLLVKIGLGMGPALPQLFQAKFALLAQELGHFFGTILLGLPLAVLLGMGREAIGATYSIDREGNVAIIAEKYGLDSPEGRGVMAMYICGTIFGALWLGIFSGAVAQLDILHPYALAMGAGVGSGSMLAASSASIVAAYPAMEKEILAYAGAANLLSGVLGIYVALFISLPIAIKLYDVFNRLLGRKDPDAIDGGN